MIDPGLQRILRLLKVMGNPQHAYKSFHVAGTNGKGSVASYLASILSRAGIRAGSFTSPHMYTPADSICIGNQHISMKEYMDAAHFVHSMDARDKVHATEFELQTAVAFEIFKRANVKVAVVEVGMGGLLDATNVLESMDVLCALITKIAIDHEVFLGTSLQEIASHKAGIVKEGVPTVLDGSNSSEVISVFQEKCKQLQSKLTIKTDLEPWIESGDIMQGEFQRLNAALAVEAIQQVYGSAIPRQTIIEGLRATKWPGRLQHVSIDGQNVLVDGAHNESSAIELAKYVQATLRPGPVHWVVGFSKPCKSILKCLVRQGDSVTCTSFSPVEDMPWIHPQPLDKVSLVAKQFTEDVVVQEDPRKVRLGPRSVVCGSLYLLKEFLARTT